MAASIQWTAFSQLSLKSAYSSVNLSQAIRADGLSCSTVDSLPALAVRLRSDRITCAIECPPVKYSPHSVLVIERPGDRRRDPGNLKRGWVQALSGAAGIAGNNDLPVLEVGGGGSDKGGSGGSWGGGGSGGGGDGNASSGGAGAEEGGNGFAGLVFKGWHERVQADPQFVFKVLTEQIIGVSACVAGDMSSRPNFGLDELDFVFSTLVVGSFVNFALMYLLAATTPAGVMSVALPGIFASCPSSHMFEPGMFSAAQRLGTFVYKGIQFASVGFVSGLAGTALSTLLLKVRKTLQPEFVTQNQPPPTILNAATWALHLGVSSNLRYQCLNGLDQILARNLSPTLFRVLVFFIRGANNVIGGSTFVLLAKVTGSQQATSSPPPTLPAPPVPEEGTLSEAHLKSAPAL